MRNKRDKNMALSDRLLRGHADRHAADALPAEGRSRAQKRGQRVGRKPKSTEAQKDEARHRRTEGATLAELAHSYGVGKSTISRLTGLNSPDPLT